MKHIKRLVIVLTIAMLLSLYLFTFKLKATKIPTNENLIPFVFNDEFLDANTLVNKEKLVGENENFKLYLDETTSYFWVEDKITGEIIRSNPNVRDPRDTLEINDDLGLLTVASLREMYNKNAKKFTFLEQGVYGSLISWSSSDQTVVTNDGILTPALEDQENEVYLTATLTREDLTATIVFRFSVDDDANLVGLQIDDSNPVFNPTAGSINNEAKEKQKSTIEISYYSSSGSIVTLNNYRLSIDHPETIEGAGDQGYKTYYIKYLPEINGFQVYYNIEDTQLDYLNFPKYMTRETYDSLESLSSNVDYLRAVRFLKQFMRMDDSKDLYFIQNYENMTGIAKTHYLLIYHDVLGYTRDEAIQENLENGYVETRDKVKFGVGVEVSLTEDGFRTAIIGESISEPKKLKMASISLYPFLGTAVSVDKDANPTKGYMVVPDGSGAIINFNNNKTDQKAFRKRIYGPDASVMPIKMPEEQESVILPLYGMVKENIGIASIVVEGEAMTSIVADVGNKVDSYNKIYATFNLRENYLYTLGTGWNTYSVSLWSRGKANTDMVIEHIILRNETNSYMGVAKAYQDHLVKEHGFVKKEVSNTAKPMIEILGAYDTKEYALGIPYTKVRALTTFKQAEIIIKGFTDEGYEVDMLFNGALNGGLRNSIQTKVSFENVLGGKKGFNKMTNRLEKEGTNVYLKVNVSQTQSFRRAFDQYTYAASRLEGQLTRDFYYHIPSQLPYSETPYPYTADDYVINPRYYEAIYDKLNRKLPTDHISFTNLGSSLTGSYKNNDTVYMQDALVLSANLLSEVGSEKQVLLSNPYGFAIPYTDYASDVPMDTTLYAIIDYHIPLLQLVYADYITYSSESLNLLADRSEEYNFLKILETGSQLKYTLSYLNPRELLNTEHTMYLSTYYEFWMETIKEQLDVLNEMNFYGGYLVEHEYIRNNVYRVKYSHGLELIINYNTNPVTIDGQLINGFDYYIKGGI